MDKMLITYTMRKFKRIAVDESPENRKPRVTQTPGSKKKKVRSRSGHHEPGRKGHAVTPGKRKRSAREKSVESGEVRGAIKRKKLVFFGHCPNERDPPAPPINLDTQNFSVKENFGLSQTPPLHYEKMSKKTPVFGKISKKNAIFWIFCPIFC